MIILAILVVAGYFGYRYWQQQTPPAAPAGGAVPAPPPAGGGAPAAPPAAPTFAARTAQAIQYFWYAVYGLAVGAALWLILKIRNCGGTTAPSAPAPRIPPIFGHGAGTTPTAPPTSGTPAIPGVPKLGPSPIPGIDWADIITGLLLLLAVYIAFRILQGIWYAITAPRTAATTSTARTSMSTGRRIFWLVVLVLVIWYSYAAFPGVRRWVNTLATTGNQVTGAILAPALSDKFNASAILYQRAGEWIVYKLDLDEPPPAFGDLWLKFVLPQTSVVRKFEVKINGRIYSAVQMPFPGACQISIKKGQLKKVTSVKVEIRGLNGWKIPAPLGPVTLYQR
ncbi:MAG: hypothetical protein WC858_06400 [Parcubacteria group bacterium]